MAGDARLPEGHALGDFLEDHRRMREFLDGLLEVLAAEPTPETVLIIVEGLDFAARHDALEEDVLFPLLRRRGVRDSLNLFDAEHGHLRSLRGQLKSGLLRWSLAGPGRGPLPRSLLQQAEAMVERYREHLDREEATVYEEAARLVDDAELWDDVERRRATF